MAQPMILQPDNYRYLIDRFNADDNELYPGLITNNQSWKFLSENIPLLDCPDSPILETYYFRWWTYRKHIKQTPGGFVITEFLPNVSWAGKYNAISCPAGIHFYEGRWLRDQRFLNEYAAYWFSGDGEPRKYSFWVADAIYRFYAVTQNEKLIKDLLPSLAKNFEAWEKSNLDSTGLFWQVDDRDGMEVSICGRDSKGIGYRPTINSYMYGDAVAIREIAMRTGDKSIALKYNAKAREIKKLTQSLLWDGSVNFFKVKPKLVNGGLCTARELLGYTPWYFNLPDSHFAAAWKYAMDSSCFYAPYGLTTADRSHPGFQLSYAGHECQWNGPSWPYATSMTLTGLANLLNGEAQNYIDKQDYFKLLTDYAASQQLVNENGKKIKWIDENLNPFTGDWISRSRLKNWDNKGWSKDKGGVERGKDYNHSSFCDLVITGLIGLRPDAGDVLTISPLLPENTWDYFCLDNVAYHGKTITIIYDKTGLRYKKAKGLSVWVNGKLAAKTEKIQKLTIKLSQGK